MPAADVKVFLKIKGCKHIFKKRLGPGIVGFVATEILDDTNPEEFADVLMRAKEQILANHIIMDFTIKPRGDRIDDETN